MTDILTSLPAALHAIAPHVDRDIWADALLNPMGRSGMVTARRAAMFLGQCAEESGGFTRLVEDLDYSHADRIEAVWPSRFFHAAGMRTAESFVGNPEALANYVYANHLGNGDEASGDGWACRGVGLIQLTGRTMQERFAASVAMTREEAFAWAQTPPGAAASACWYWLARERLLALSDIWDIQGVTQRINGGLVNLPARVALCNAALAALGGQAPVPAASEPSDADKLNADELGKIKGNPAG